MVLQAQQYSTGQEYILLLESTTLHIMQILPTIISNGRTAFTGDSILLGSLCIATSHCSPYESQSSHNVIKKESHNVNFRQIFTFASLVPNYSIVLQWVIKHLCFSFYPHPSQPTVCSLTNADFKIQSSFSILDFILFN